MSDVTLEVFYSKTCPNCPAQKKLVKEFDEEAKVKMTDVAENQGRAKNHGVLAVPTTVVDGPALDEKVGFKGVTSEDRVETAVEVAKGDRDPEELKSDGILGKLKEMFG